MTLLLAGIVLDITQILGLVFILFCFLNDIDFSGQMTSPTTVFVFFEGLSLGLISKRRIMGPNLIFQSLILMFSIGFVLVFFDQQLISPQVSKTNLLCPGKQLEVGFYFYINNIFYHLIPHIQIPLLIIQLSLNRWIQSFLKIAYQGLFIRGSNRFKFFQYSL